MVSDSIREEEDMKKMCPKCKGKGCSHCGGKGYHNMNKGGIMNKGMKALKKEAPDVAKKMCYKHGGMSHKKSGYMCGGMSKMNDMRKTGMFYGGMTKKKKA